MPVRRNERQSAGELLHLDTKKLGRFYKPGHRFASDRTQNTSRAGWQALHVAIDDHSRVGFSQMLADGTALIGEISTATADQSTGIAQVGDAVTQLDQVTQQNATLVEEGAAAAESLKNQAMLLDTAVRVFKL